MLKHNVCKYMAKLLTLVLVAALVLALPLAMDAKAADGMYDVAEYKGDKAQADWTYPTGEGQVFAGWFTDETCTVSYKETTGQAYAKFVSANLMTVKKQLTAAATVSSPTVNVRFITAIDSLKLSGVTFHVAVEALDKTWAMTENTAYKGILVDGQVDPATPEGVFGAGANYFVLHTLKNVPKEAFEKGFDAYVSWQTLDGTVVTAPEVQQFTVENELLQRGQYTVMSNNILAVGLYENTVPATRYGQLYSALEKYAPDVLALQECDWSWHGYMLDENQFNEAANHGLQALSGLGYAAVADEWGMVTDSLYITDNNVPLYYKADKLDLLAYGFVSYGAQRESENRGFTWGVFAEEGSTTPLFAASSTHIATAEAADVAQAQIEELVAFMKGIEEQYGAPVVMMGDYNTDPGDAHYSAMELGTKLLNTRDVADVVAGSEYQTHNLIGRIPDGADASYAGVIDHILISPTGIVANEHRNLVEQISDGVYTYTYSDHIPVLAKLQLVPKTHTHSFAEGFACDGGTHVRYCSCGVAEHETHSWALDEQGNVICSVCGNVEAQYTAKYHCICGAAVDGEHTCQQEEYKFYLPWVSETSLPNSGDFYLVNDVLTQYQRHVTETVNLDLNGKSVTAEEGRRVLVADGGSLSICDSTGTGRVYSTGTSGQGLVAWVKGNSQLNLYSGIFDGSAISTTAYGATVAMENGGTFNMYGGTVKGGTTTGDGSAVGGYGGTTFNLYGGDIYGATANVGGAVFTSGSFAMDGGTIHGGTATYGGSLYLGGDSTYTISGGAITGGVATGNGGNIFTAADYVKLDVSGDAVISYGKSEGNGGNICAYGPVTVGGSAQLLNDEAHKINGGGGNIYGGNIVTVKDNAVVSGGYAVKAGGNILMNFGCYLFIQDNAQILNGYTDDSGGNIRGHINMSGGKVLGGIAKANGASYNMHIHDRDLNMSGGLIDGGVWVSSTTTVTLSGNAQIKGGWSNLCINDGIKVAVSEGFAGEIWVDTPTGEAFSGENMGAYAKYFYSTDGYSIGLTDTGALQLVDGLYHCICGAGIDGNHTCKTPEYHVYTKWESENSIPTSGYYYLTKGVTLANQTSVTGDLHIDLNGQFITRTPDGNGNTRGLVPENGGVLTVCDSSADQNGRIYGATASNGQQGACIMIRNTGTLNLYSGIIDGSGITTTNYGATIAVDWANASNGHTNTFNMYGGQVIGGTTSGDGGAIAVKDPQASFNMYGGTVTGGTAGAGGAVFSSGGFTMSGGTITGGTATNVGGNIYLSGARTYYISGGTISNGKSTSHGGNIATESGSVSLEISGDTQITNVEDRKIGGGGGNIWSNGTLTLKDDVIVSGGYATSAGGNILMAYGYYVYVQDNVQILNGYTNDSGGNIRGHINMSGGKIAGGTAINNSASCNVHVHQRALTMSGGVIEGGAWMSDGTKVTLSGNAQIKGGSSNLWLHDGIKVTIVEDFAGEVWIDLPDNSTGIFSGEGMSAYAQYFYSTDGHTVSVTDTGALQLITAEVQENTRALRVGFSRVDITPQESVPLEAYGDAEQRWSEGYITKLYTHCVAITDTDGNTILLMNSDTSWGDLEEQIVRNISDQTGIPQKNIVHCGNHTHSGVATSLTKYPAVTRYNEMYVNAVVQAAQEAMADRVPSQVYTSSAKTEGLTFSRRFYRADGTLAGDNAGALDKNGNLQTSPLKEYETVADGQLQMLRFERLKKKMC